MAAEKKILIVDDVHAAYGAAKILNGVSLYLAEGEIVAVLGTAGCGKSTLLKCICGSVRPQIGNIVLSIDGKNISLINKMPYEIVQLGVSFVAEGKRILRELTVKENLQIAAYKKDARQKLRENLNFVYDIFPVLKEREKQIAGTLSGGEQQMLALAMGLLTNPKVLVIDEPSQGLAPVIIKSLMTKIKELRDRYGLTILMSEQNFIEAAKIADRGYLLSFGKIAFQAEASKLSNHEIIKKYYFA